jgi:dihydroneopterin aldolase
MSDADRIEIRSIRVEGRHGALPGEQRDPQPFEIDLDLFMDLAPAAHTDELADTVDYGAVALTAARIVREERFSLLEALAGAIATELLCDERLSRVRVSLRKLRPPIPLTLGSTGVTITRGRT